MENDQIFWQALKPWIIFSVNDSLNSKIKTTSHILGPLAREKAMGLLKLNLQVQNSSNPGRDHIKI